MRQSQPTGNVPDLAGEPGAGPGPADLLERPLSARSVIASLLLGMDPPRMRPALLVRWCGLFGIAGGTARVALSRMVARDELASREGFYELAGRLGRRRREQEWSLAPRTREWGGGWRMATVDPVARSASDRQALRAAMRHLRFAEVREGVWTRPDNLPDQAVPAGARVAADSQCRWWTTRPDGDPVVAAAGWFELARWSSRGDALGTRLEAVTERLARGEVGLEADAFIVGAAVLVHVRSDPLLPGSLLPAGWPGPALRAGYAAYRVAFGHAAAAWFREQPVSGRSSRRSPSA